MNQTNCKIALESQPSVFYGQSYKSIGVDISVPGSRDKQFSYPSCFKFVVTHQMNMNTFIVFVQIVNTKYIVNTNTFWTMYNDMWNCHWGCTEGLKPIRSKKKQKFSSITKCTILQQLYGTSYLFKSHCLLHYTHGLRWDTADSKMICIRLNFNIHFQFQATLSATQNYILKWALED